MKKVAILTLNKNGNDYRSATFWFGGWFMVWNAMILDDTDWSFKKIIILSLKKKVLLLALLFNSKVIFDAKISVFMLEFSFWGNSSHQVGNIVKTKPPITCASKIQKNRRKTKPNLPYYVEIAMYKPRVYYYELNLRFCAYIHDKLWHNQYIGWLTL